MIKQAQLQVAQPQSLARKIAGVSMLERHVFTLARSGFSDVWIPAGTPAAIRVPSGVRLHWGAPPEEIEAMSVVAEDLPRLDHRKRLGYFPLEGRDEREAVNWLLGGARKSTDGLMASHFDRGLSLALTRRLLSTKVRPNHMTVFSTIVGLIGAAFFLKSGHAFHITAAGLVWLHTVLDGCDGELARLRFEESKWGGLLDFWGDNVVHVALFAAIAASLAAAHPYAPRLGAAACVATLAAAWLGSPNHGGLPLRKESPTPWDRFLEKLEIALAQRDFIYLLVLAAAFGREHIFLTAAGIGTPAYVAIMSYLKFAKGDKL